MKDDARFLSSFCISVLTMLCSGAFTAGVAMCLDIAPNRGFGMMLISASLTFAVTFATVFLKGGE